MFKVLVVESDQHCSSQYCSYLKKHGYETLSAFDADEAMELFRSNRINLVMSEILLPGIDGAMLAGAIRKLDADVPIMIVTELDDISSKKRAFSVDVDDYLVKPADLHELELRISALLRRAHAASKRQIIIGNALLDSDTLSVVIHDSETILPPKEFMLLLKLCSTPGQVFTRRDIMSDIWGVNSDSDERTVDVHIKRLRERFDEKAGFAIETVRGVGYRAITLLPQGGQSQ